MLFNLSSPRCCNTFTESAVTGSVRGRQFDIVEWRKYFPAPTVVLARVRTPSEIKKSRVFQGCFAVFSRAFPGFLEVQNENNIHNEL